MKILAVIGTRPEAIKMAPVIAALNARRGSFEVSVCLTAQHRELLDGVIRTFDIAVQHDLDLMSPDQSITDVTCSVLRGMDPILQQECPDLVLVHGDTTTSFAAALASFYRKIPVGHIEAGLRTHNKHQPYPEEINRRLADALCDYHYAPTDRAKENLLRENVPADNIHITGNTVIDAMLDVVHRPYSFDDPLLEALGTDRRLIVVTAHRRESFGEPFRDMCLAMRDLVENNPDVELVYPVHPNPNVQEVTDEVLSGCDRLHLVDPLEYLPFMHVLKKSTLVLTDSGGIQEEVPSLGKPVLVMRDVTERPEGIEAGTSALVGTRRESIRDGVQRLLDDSEAYSKMATAANPYGDGKAAQRIAEHIETLI